MCDWCDISAPPLVLIPTSSVRRVQQLDRWADSKSEEVLKWFSDWQKRKNTLSQVNLTSSKPLSVEQTKPGTHAGLSGPEPSWICPTIKPWNPFLNSWTAHPKNHLLTVVRLLAPVQLLFLSSGVKYGQNIFFFAKHCDVTVDLNLWPFGYQTSSLHHFILLHICVKSNRNYRINCWVMAKNICNSWGHSDVDLWTLGTKTEILESKWTSTKHQDKCAFLHIKTLHLFRCSCHDAVFMLWFC